MTITLVFAGCATPPERVEYPEAGELPTDWASSGAAAGDIEDAWWLQFGESGLEELIVEGLEGNPGLQAMGARVDAAVAQARIAGADLQPTLGFGAGATRSQQVIFGLPFPGVDVVKSRNTTYGLSLNSMWELDVWGRVRAGQQAAIADVQAGMMDLGGARLSMIGQITKSWIHVKAARAQMELAEQTAGNFRSTAETIRRRYESGLSSSLDLRLALNSAESAEALLESRRLEYSATVRQLEVLIGRYPSGALNLDGSLPELFDTVPTGLPSQLLERRPDLIAAERRLAATDERLWQSKAAMLPRISLTASGGTSAPELGDVLDSNFSIWSIAANLSQPVFQGGRLRAGVDLSEARVQEAAAGYVDAVLTAFRDVETALEGERMLAAREEHLVEAARLSDGALKLANLRYETGLDPIINVLESQRRSLNDAGLAIEIRRQRLANRIDLHLALGGGFEVPDFYETVPDPEALGPVVQAEPGRENANP